MKTTTTETNKITAYLHFGGPFTTEQPAPRQTVSAPAFISLLPWQKRGLMYTASGYGRRIPTTYKVKFNGKMYRVYCCIFSNAGTCYIISKGKPLATVDIYNN